MKFQSYDIVFQEVPDHISLAFSITGCEIGCRGCHSTDLWKKNAGIELTPSLYLKILDKYKTGITCVVFLGGEWESETLAFYLSLAKKRGLKTCLYTGETEVASFLYKRLDFIKLGPWVPELGGLDSKLTNQKFIDLDNNKILNYKFHSKDNKNVCRTEQEAKTTEAGVY